MNERNISSTDFKRFLDYYDAEEPSSFINRRQNFKKEKDYINNVVDIIDSSEFDDTMRMVY